MTRTILLALTLLALAACGGQPRERAGAPVPATAVTAPNFGDVEPHDWDGRSPASYAVHGTDTSRYQTSVDWRTARANGVNFTFIKSTEGADNVDPMFRDHWRGARAAGIRTGAYHFWYHCAPGRDQARNFIARVPRAPGALPPVLDLEWTPFSPTCTRRPPTAELLREAQDFIDIVARHYGQRPLVYVSPDIYRERSLDRLRGVEFWLRSVAGHPSKVYPGHGWTFWQYSGTGTIPGIAGKADLNVFNGGSAAWAAWLASSAR
ncbi:MAG: glycoside hydrolase family 25 protein [Gemmobacter sp.]